VYGVARMSVNVLAASIKIILRAVFLMFLKSQPDLAEASPVSASSSSAAPSRSSGDLGPKPPASAWPPGWLSRWRGAFASLPRGMAPWAVLVWWYAAVPVIIFYATLLPRLQLARSLDLVTDESVYISAGALDVTLLQAHNLTNPWWLFNHEAPALPKLIIGLGTLYGAQHDGAISGWLYGARAPAAWLSAFSLVAFFYLMGPIVGRRASALGTMALALSPWLAFFGALAYLDTYLLCFMTLAAPLIWHAARRPWLYPIAGLFAGLAFGSKYTGAALAVPCILYLFYYYRVVARRRPSKWLILAPVVAALTFYISDPIIWLSPFSRLWNSILFQFDHASNGHDVFWNGAVWEHVPAGIGLFILLAKLSLLLTIPAALTLIWGTARLWRRWRAHAKPSALDDRLVFTLTWLVGLLVPFGVLPIVVGTHYMLPLAPPTAIVAAWGFILASDALAARWAGGLARWASSVASALPSLATLRARAASVGRLIGLARATPARSARFVIAAALTVVVAVALIAPPARALATTNQAEGYTAEWLNGENSALQVAYPGYTDAVNWIIAHSQGRTTVTLISTRGALDFWRDMNRYRFPQRIRMAFGTPTDFPQSQYIVWPEHLVQRRFPTPPTFNSLIVARMQGGATTYCVILRWPHPNR
jgi:4-amino-4-deoxy-L-arabinose transferase-like glycosyltransferase